jgi:hypothetical protein
VWQNGHFDPSEKDRVFADQNDMNSAAVQRRHDETRHQEVQAEIAQEDRFIAEMEAAKHQEMFMQPFGAEGAFIGLYNAAQLGMAGGQLVNSCREGVGECVQAAAPLVVAGALTHQAMKSGAVVDPGTPAPAGAATADVLGSQDRAYWTDTQAVSDNPATRFQQDKLGVTNLQDYNLEEIKDGGGGAEKPAGPLIVDVQSGPMIDQAGRRGFLTHIVSKTPGARGIAIEPGDYKLGYAGIIPTSKQDLNFARMLLQNMPEWPGPGETNWAEWQFDPNVPFPKTGDVTVLQGPAGAGRTPVPRTFFPPVSKIPGDVLPTNLKDVSGLDPTTLPELHGKVDQMYWRRGFGLSKADAPTVAALGKEVDQMLKPGGFIEVRVLPASDATRARQLAAAIPGSRVVEVPQSAIKAYAATPTRPSGLSDEQWSVLESAGPDIRNEYPTLGQGVFNRIIRIYKP